MSGSNSNYYGGSSNQSNYANYSTPVDVNVDSLYGLLTVKDARGTRGFYINGGIMSEMVLDNELLTANGWRYLDCFEISYLMNPKINDVLVLGLGTGVGSRKLAAKYGSDIDNVEINDKVFELAKRYFNFSTSEKMKVYIEDARVFLDDTDKNYALIISDVYRFDPAAGYEIPVPLTTQEFFRLVKEHLRPGGIFAVNIAAAPNSAFLNSEYKTIRTVFDNAYIFNCATQVVIASKDRAYDIDALKGIAPDLDRFLSTATSPSLNSTYPVYTDAFTPVY
jgi:predicted membrane-bound spermidine synthase